MAILGKSVRIDREALASVPTPDPTDTWRPVPHSQVLDIVESRLEASGFEVLGRDLGVAKDGLRFFGTLDISACVLNGDSGGVRLAVGVRNSHDKKFCQGMTGGTRVLVCDNLMFTGDIVVTRRHTLRAVEEFEERVAAGVAGLEALAGTEGNRVRRMMDRDLEDRDAHDFVVRAADERVIPWSHVPKVLEEWRRPSHPEFEPRNLWSLTNAFTEVAKARFTRNPMRTASETIRLTSLLEGFASQTAAA